MHKNLNVFIFLERTICKQVLFECVFLIFISSNGWSLFFSAWLNPNDIHDYIENKNKFNTKNQSKKFKEAIKQAAKEMERREKKETKGKASGPDLSTQLWTDRYAPKNLKEICGNKGQIEKLQLWLHDW